MFLCGIFARFSVLLGAQTACSGHAQEGRKDAVLPRNLNLFANFVAGFGCRAACDCICQRLLLWHLD